MAYEKAVSHYSGHTERSSLGSPAEVETVDRERIALQLYTARRYTAEDMPGTLRKVADLGYRTVEFAGYESKRVVELRSCLDSNNLQAIGAHVPLDDWNLRGDKVIAELRGLGCTYAVVPSAPVGSFDNPESLSILARTLNQLGEKCREAGLRLAYHNHAFEFTVMGQSNAWEALVSMLDPDKVFLELDLYWASYAEANILSLLRDYGSRTPLVHAKDMAPEGDSPEAMVGDGAIPWGKVIETDSPAKKRWYIVELDESRVPMKDAERSLKNLRRLLKDHEIDDGNYMGME